MALPIRSIASVMWYDPRSDLSPDPSLTSGVGSRGWGVDHWAVDSRDTGDLFDPSKPPTMAQDYWNNSTTSSHIFIPEIRGAIFRPNPIPLNTADDLLPVDSDWSTRLNYHTSNDPSSAVWILTKGESLGGIRDVALFSPPNLTTTPVGYIRTLQKWQALPSFSVVYRLAVPEAQATNGIPKRSGLLIHLGMNEEGPQWTLDLRSPATDFGQSTYFNTFDWALWRWVDGNVANCVREDLAPASAFGENYSPRGLAGETANDCVTVQCVGGYLVVRSGGFSRAWVYRHDANPPDSFGGGDRGFSVRAGYVGMEIHNARGWVELCRVLYPTTMVHTSPTYYVESDDWTWKTGQGILEDTGPLYNDGSASYEASFTYHTNGTTNSVPSNYHYTFRITNQSPTVTVGYSNGTTGHIWTPFIWRFGEYHPTSLGTVDGFESYTPVDLSQYVESFDINFDESGRGATGNVVLRNLHVTNDGTYLPGYLSNLLYGCGKVTIEACHYYDEDDLEEEKTHVFTGYAMEVTYDDSNTIPKVTLTLRDRTALWGNGRANMAFMPSLSGLYFEDAVRLVLNRWGVDDLDIIFPASYIDDVKRVPSQIGSGAFTFDQMEDAQNVLDRLCEVCSMSWKITPEDKIEFEYYPPLVLPRDATPDFVIDINETTEVDQIEADFYVSHSYDMTATHALGIGQDKWGYPIFRLWQRSYSVRTVPSNPHFVGREMWVTRSEPENPTVSQTAKRQLEEEALVGHRIYWTTLGKDLRYGYVVKCSNAPFVGLSNPTTFVIKAKNTKLSVVEDSPLWTDSYIGTVVNYEDLPDA